MFTIRELGICPCSDFSFVLVFFHRCKRGHLYRLEPLPGTNIPSQGRVGARVFLPTITAAVTVLPLWYGNGTDRSKPLEFKNSNLNEKLKNARKISKSTS
jgi:hypothetical protein